VHECTIVPGTGLLIKALETGTTQSGSSAFRTAQKLALEMNVNFDIAQDQHPPTLQLGGVKTPCQHSCDKFRIG